jgi:hypothetical protein
MRFQGITILAAAAMLAAGIAAVSAQGTGTGTGAGAGAGGSMNEGQCWDEASKQVKSKPATAGGTASTQPPSGTTGAAPKSPTTGGTRPAGMANC